MKVTVDPDTEFQVGCLVEELNLRVRPLRIRQSPGGPFDVICDCGKKIIDRAEALLSGKPELVSAVRQSNLPRWEEALRGLGIDLKSLEGSSQGKFEAAGTLLVLMDDQLRD